MKHTFTFTLSATDGEVFEKDRTCREINGTSEESALWQEVLWNDLGYRCKYVLHENKYSLHFKVFRGEEGAHDNAFFSGFIKWDGCCELYFCDRGEDRGRYFHFCGKGQLGALSMVFNRLYGLAADEIPNYDE